MNSEIQNILDQLDYQNVIIKTEDSQQKLSDFNEWHFGTFFDYKGNKIKCITFESGFFWNEQILESLLPIRKKCIENYGYDIIPLDFDICGTFDLWDGNVNNEDIRQCWINKIHHICRKFNISVKYFIRGANDNNGIIYWIDKNIYNLNKKEILAFKRLYKYFLKKYNIEIFVISYYGK